MAFFLNKTLPENWGKRPEDTLTARTIVGRGKESWRGKLLFGLVVAAAALLWIIWNGRQVKSPQSLAWAAFLIFFFALGMLAIGSRRSRMLHNQIGLALVSGLVLALAAFVVNLAIEDALVTNARDRREAETKLAINRREQWIFRSEDLEGLTFSGMSFTRPAEEEPFDFSYAKMAGIGLEDADLRKAVLRNADLRDASMCGANLAGADLSRAVLNGAHLEGSSLSNARLIGTQLRGARLGGADLTDADLTDADLTGADLTGADLTGADLNQAVPSGDDAEPTDTSVDKPAGTATSNQPEPASCGNSDSGDRRAPTGTDLTGAVLEGADLSGADLTGAIIASDQLDKVIVSHDTTCPNGQLATPDDDRGGEASCRDATGQNEKPESDPKKLLTVKPTTPIGFPVGRVARTAGVGGTFKFELLRVTCLPKDQCDDRDSLPFSVDADGVLRVVSPLTPEVEYTLTVGVNSAGEQESQQEVPSECGPAEKEVDGVCEFEILIFVEKADPIDTRLQFLVPADVDPGTPIARIKDLAPSDTSGPGGEQAIPILTTGDDRFRIQEVQTEDNGTQEETSPEWVVVVDSVLEANSTYEVVVQSGPNVDPPWTVRIAVPVFPRNDPPEITVASETLVLSRTAQVGDVVGTVEATDPNRNDALLFTIISSERAVGKCDDDHPSFPLHPMRRPFSIDPSSGVIRVRIPLMALPGCHRIQIEVRDDAAESQAHTATLLVQVTDELPAPKDSGLSWLF